MNITMVRTLNDYYFLGTLHKRFVLRTVRSSNCYGTCSMDVLQMPDGSLILVPTVYSVHLKHSYKLFYWTIFREKYFSSHFYSYIPWNYCLDSDCWNSVCCRSDCCSSSCSCCYLVSGNQEKEA